MLCASNLREKKFPALVEALARMATAETSETEEIGGEIAGASGDRVLVFCAGKSTAKWVRAELTKLLDADTLMARARGLPTADWAIYRNGGPVDEKLPQFLCCRRPGTPYDLSKKSRNHLVIY